MVFVKNKGTYDAYVRTIFAFEAGNYTTADEFKGMMHLNLNSTDWTWQWLEEPVTIGESTYFVVTATYNYVLTPGALTEISLSQIALDKTATNADVEAFGETYHILVKTQAIQSAGFVDASTALNDGFMEVTAENIPWETDIPVQGAAMKNAFHYLNADPTGTKITTKVTNVIFGLNSSYPKIVKEYDGVLITEDQDVPVYVYYKPNGANYDIYCLAADKIYTPKDSTELFRDMSALKTVDTSNLDVSRTENMFRMFQSCGKLTELDTENWDTSAATNMDGVFNSNRSLKVVDLSSFDTQNVQDMDQMFDGCSSLENVIGLNKWDTSSLRWIQEFFTGTKVQVIDLSSFNMSKVSHTTSMFSGNPELTTIYVGDHWNLNAANLQSSGGMFNGDPKLTGANGTTTAGNPTDGTYARVDTPAVLDAEGNVITEATPGYLTHINDAPVAP